MEGGNEGLKVHHRFPYHPNFQPRGFRSNVEAPRLFRYTPSPSQTAPRDHRRSMSSLQVAIQPHYTIYPLSHPSTPLSFTPSIPFTPLIPSTLFLQSLPPQSPQSFSPSPPFNPSPFTPSILPPLTPFNPSLLHPLNPSFPHPLSFNTLSTEAPSLLISLLCWAMVALSSPISSCT